jgi:hypothetical protein
MKKVIIILGLISLLSCEKQQYISLRVNSCIKKENNFYYPVKDSITLKYNNIVITSKTGKIETVFIKTDGNIIISGNNYIKVKIGEAGFYTGFKKIEINP